VLRDRDTRAPGDRPPAFVRVVNLGKVGLVSLLLLSVAMAARRESEGRR